MMGKWLLKKKEPAQHGDDNLSYAQTEAFGEGEYAMDFTPSDRVHPAILSESASSASSDLGALLLFSANEVGKNSQELSAQSAGLGRAISHRVSSEARLLAQGLRLTIGVVWLLIGAILLFLAKEGIPSISDPAAIFATGLAKGLTVAEASGLARFFLIAGGGAAFLGVVSIGYITYRTGSNRDIRRQAERLGQHIAGVASGFDTHLTKLLQNVHQEHEPANAMASLSRAHLTAFEAQIYFNRVKYLNEERRHQALAELSASLSGNRGQGGSTISVFLAGLLTGLGLMIVITLLMAMLGGKAPASGASVALLPDIMRFPKFFMILVYGGFLYAIAGLLCDAIKPFMGATRHKGLEDALDTVRGAYTAQNAPRHQEVIRRIDDAMGVFRARLDSLSAEVRRADGALETPEASDKYSKINGSQGEVQGSQSQNHQAGLSAQNLDSPPWRDRGRDRDTRVRFVDSGFQSAPRPFRHRRSDSEDPR